MRNLRTRTRILLLVVLAALPAILLSSYGAYDRRRSAENQARQEIARIARLAASEQRRLVEGVKRLMEASAQITPSIRSNLPRCKQYFADLQQKNTKGFHAMGLFDANGRLVCDGRARQTPVYAGEREFFRQARASADFVVGQYQIGYVSKREGITFGYPFVGPGGHVEGVLFAGVPLSSLGEMAESTPLPEGGILNVIDGSGTILARKPVEDARLGEKLRNARVLEQIFSAASGGFEAKGVDGIDRLFAFEAVTRNPDGRYPLLVMVSVPLDKVFADADRELWRDIYAILAAAAVFLLAIWWGVDYFVLQNIRALLAAAQRVHEGDLSARTGLRYGKEEINQVARAFDEMAEALERRQHGLIERAITDPLTGLHNRRHLDDVLPRELERARRNGDSIALILIDIDHFKPINDTYGHPAGDAVLRLLGEFFRSRTRSSDTMCRFGGEEFALLLRSTGRDAARRRAEDLRVGIAGLDLSLLPRGPRHITASLGFAVVPDDARDAPSLLKAADEALYEAKGAGRNRVFARPGPRLSAAGKR